MICIGSEINFRVAKYDSRAVVNSRDDANCSYANSITLARKVISGCARDQMQRFCRIREQCDVSLYRIVMNNGIPIANEISRSNKIANQTVQKCANAVI